MNDQLIDLDRSAELLEDFLKAVPRHVFQLLRCCLLKATVERNDREIVILVPDLDFARCLLAQSELRTTALQLGVTSLKLRQRNTAKGMNPF